MPGCLRALGLQLRFQRPDWGKLCQWGGGGCRFESGRLGPQSGLREIADAQELRTLIRVSVGGDGKAQTSNWTVERDGRRLVLPITPKPERTESGWSARIGAYVGAPPPLTVVRTDWFDSVVHGLVKTGEMSLMTLKMMPKMVTGDASLKNLSGPISIADHAGKSAHNGFISYASFGRHQREFGSIEPAVPVLMAGT